MWSEVLADPAARLKWLRRLLLGACLITLSLSSPLWLNARAYPVLPIAESFPVLGHGWDRCLFAGTLLCLVLAFWKYGWGVAGFLLSSLFLVLQDQNRCQPWFYLYWVMLLLALLPPAAAVSGARLAVSAVYFWAGIYKCNPQFQAEVAPFFLGAISPWVPGFLLPLAKLAIATAPVMEVFIALAVWGGGRWRVAALAAAVVIHLTALVVLGPWGRNFNAVVWPWNVVMLALLIVLFSGSTPESPWRPLRQPAWAGLVVAALWGLPILGLYGCWDSYLSFSLYSGSTDRANIYVSAAMKGRLPANMQAYVQPSTRGTGEPLQFDFRNWAESEIKVPPIPEARAYRSVARYLSNWAVEPDDLRLVIEERNGVRSFLRAADLRQLPPTR